MFGVTMLFRNILYTFGVIFINNIVFSQSQGVISAITNIINKPVSKLLPLQSQLSEDGKLNFTQLSKKYGFHCEKHEVITADGYILTLFHIPGKGRPHLLAHGILDASDTFIIRGNISLVITLAKAGRDVWTGNFRGTRYSIGHTKLNPNDKDFWNFTLHELGYYDYPAFIDYVLKQTGQEKLTIIGHSQGTTSFFILGALRPKYNNKINVFIALAPVAYINHLKNYFNLIAEFEPIIKGAFDALGVVEILRDGSILRNLIEILCTQDTGSYELCVKGVIFSIAGSDPEQLEPKFINVLFGHYPLSISLKTVYHFAQISNRDKFAEYDYGENQNMALYGSKTPPDYDLKNVTAKIALLVGPNDYIATIGNVALLRERLPNVIEYRELSSNFNHADFVWGNHMPELLFPYIFDLLEKYP